MPPPESPAACAEEAAAFLLGRVQQARGRLWDGGPRATEVTAASPALATLARRRVRGISDAVVRGLCAWSRGERPVDLLRGAIPTATEVLARQAHGRRCASLLPDEQAAAHGDPRHPDGLSFLLHDLEHLEKFVAPEHFLGQVGFFRAVAHAFADPTFAALEAQLDETWRADRDYVVSDMNGSAIFLFSVLKMKVNMAIRRREARRTGVPAPTAGPISAPERPAVDEAQAILIRALGLPAEAATAAHQVSARRDHPGAARALLAGFESLARSPL